MTVTSLPLIAAKIAETVETAQYTAIAPNSSVTVDKFKAVNIGSGNAKISISIIPVSGTAANSRLIDDRTLAEGETYLCPEMVGSVLSEGEIISTIAVGTVIIRASGREIS